MKTKTLTQCKIQRGISFQYSWIPSNHAIEKHKILLGDDPKPWTVVKVFKTIGKSDLQLFNRDHRNMKKVTDVTRENGVWRPVK